MKQIYTILFLFVCAGAWGQAGRLHRLAGPDTTVIATRSYADTYDNSTSGAVPTTQQSMLDSLAGFQSFANIASIQAASPRVGYRLEDRRTGIRYKVQADSVLYYSIDDSLVIDLGGKYAVADLSYKRTFSSFNEFDREASLLGFTGAAEYVTISGIKIKVTPTPDLIGGNPDNIDTTADGFYLKRFNTAFEGENILKTSRYFNPVSSSTGWVFRPDYKLNYSTSVDGLQEAVLLTGIDSTDSNTRTIFTYPVSGKAQADSTYTFSFDIKYISGSGNLRYKVNLGDDVSISKDGEWHRDDNTFTLTNTTFVRIDFYGFSPEDSILFSRPNLGKGGPTTYKPTTFGVAAESGTMYLNTGAAITKNKWVNLDLLGPPIQATTRQIGDHTELINNGLIFCQEGKVAKGIQLAEGVYHASYINFPQNTGIRGVSQLQTGDDDQVYATRGTAIFAREVPENKHFLDLSLPSGESIRYNAWVTDLWIELRDTMSPGYDLMHIEESQSGVFQNLMFTAYDTESYTVERAIKMSTTVSSDQTKNIVDNIKVKGNGGDGDTSYGIDTAFVYQGSAGNKIGRLDLNRTKVGFVARSGIQCNINTFLFAQNCETSILVENAQVSVQGLYTEGAGLNGGRGAIEMKGGRLDCYDCTLQSESTSDSLWTITGGTSLSIYGGQIRTLGLTKTEGIQKINFFNVGSTAPLRDLPIDDVDMKRRITIQGNYNWQTKESFKKDRSGDYLQDYVLTDKSTIKNTVLADEITLSGVELIGQKANYLWPSNTLPGGNFGTPDSIIVKTNNFTAPNGELEAETIIYTGGDIGGGSLAWGAWNMLDTFDIDEEYVFGLWVYPHQSMQVARGLFEIRPYSDPDNEVEWSFYAPPNQWSFTTVNGIINDNTGTDVLSIRFRSTLPVGDSISIWGGYLKRGEFEGGFVETSSNGIDNDSLITVISGNGTWVLDGNVEITGTLNADPSYFQTTGTATPTTDVSGQFNITHGLGTTPTHLSVGNLSGTEYNFEYSCGSTSCTVTVYDGTGTDTTVPSTALSISWAAFR